MTREEIKNTPEIVDFVISESLMTESKEKLHKRLDEICNLAIEALEQEPCGDTISRQEVLKLFATHDGKYLYEAIRDMPSVKQVPKTDVLDKIRAEIADLIDDDDEFDEFSYGDADCNEYYKAVLDALEIIDKYN